MTSPSDIVLRLGGPELVAGKFNISLKALEMWERRGFIPGRWHVPMLRLAAERGVPLAPDELWLLPEPAEARA